MTYEKREYIKTSVFESKTRALIKDINETEHITKTGILRALECLMKDCVDYEEPKFEIIKELRV